MAASSVPETLQQPIIFTPETGESGRPAGPGPGSSTTTATKGPTQTQRPLDPHHSIDDYSRVMLQYIQRRMSTFVNLDEGRGSPSSSSGSSGSSRSSGNNTSNRSSDASSSSDAAASNPLKEAVDRLQF